MITIPTLLVLNGTYEKTIQYMHANSVGKGWFIVSENITEKRHGAVLLVVKLDMMEDFPWAKVIRAATFGRKVIKDCCSFHHVANNGSWERLARNPMISGTNMM